MNMINYIMMVAVFFMAIVKIAERATKNSMREKRHNDRYNNIMLLTQRHDRDFRIK